MIDKFDIPGPISADPLKKTAEQLCTKDVVSLASASSKHVQMFKPVLDIRQFLHHVTHGNHEAVKAMLAKAIANKDMSFFYRKSLVTDCSGRTFENISGFEYALWALDKHMWTTILECIPENDKSIRLFLKGQCDNIKNKGVTYILNGKTITESHFDFKSTIIKALETLVSSMNQPGLTTTILNRRWLDTGVEQTLLPMHVVYEYCSPEPFGPTSYFIKQPRPSKLFFNWSNHKEEPWFHVDSKLGVNFAIYKGGRTTPAANGEATPVIADLEAMKVLYDVRSKDFLKLESLLEKQSTLDDQFGVEPMQPDWQPCSISLKP